MKLAYASLIALALGLPINQFWHFSLVLIIGLAFTGFDLNKNLKYPKIFLGLILCLSLQYLPELEIQEGHKVLIHPNNTVIGMDEILDEKNIENPAAFSVDGIWQNPKYSRIVSEINTDLQTNDVSGFKIGEINSLPYNYYSTDEQTALFDRSSLPILVFYEFPKEAQGMEISWQGDAYWPVEGGYDLIDFSSTQTYQKQA
ncbi:MAG: hypothetical protein ACKOAD_01450 [Gammaproteobacteria bacterium]